MFNSKKTYCWVLITGIILMAVLAAGLFCLKGYKTTAESNKPLEQTPKAKEIVLYNWEDYTNKSILEDFQKKYGIQVILKEYKTPDMMLSEIQSRPQEYDVLMLPDETVFVLRQCRLLTELDLSKIA